MKLKSMAIFGLVLSALLVAPGKLTSQDAHAAASLQVRINYTGAGPVDEKHKVYVVLWDSPDFTKTDSMPVDMQPSTSKNGVVTFSDVKKSPAYISAVYDASGQWDAQSVPPEGSSLGLYSTTPGTPEPIEVTAGKPKSIVLAFDDSVKMRSGKPAK